MNEIILLLSKQKKLWVQNCRLNHLNPVPINLICLLGKAGFILSEKFQGLISPEDEKRFLDILDPYFFEIFGLDQRWKSVWSTPENLPKSKETQKLIQMGLYMNPDKLDEIRENQKDTPEFWERNNWTPKNIIEPGYDSDITELSRSLFESPIPLNHEDKGILGWIMENRGELVEVPDKIPVKETLAISLSYGYGEECISGINDILRVASYMSGCSVLGKTERFHLSKKNRKIFLGLLENYLTKKHIKRCLPDAKKYKDQWKILAYHCHPTPSKYPEVFRFIGEIKSRSEDMVHGWNSKLQRAYDSKNYKKVISLLTLRPSEFIRRYDSLLRKAWESKDTSLLNDVQDAFLTMSTVPSKVLFELYKYYGGRGEEIQRSFLGKFGIRRIYSSLPGLPQELIDIAKFNIIQTIRKGWKSKDTFNRRKVYLDFSERTGFSLSFRSGITEQTDPMFPGQIIEFPTTGMIRFFLQWIDPSGREDLDLHAWLITKENRINEISWNSGFSDGTKFITHSGDIRNQKGNCAEYVTVDYSKQFDCDWILITIQNFNGFRLCDLDNWIGISEITGEEKNKRWVPSDISTLFRGKVDSKARDMVAFIANLKEGWAQLILEGISVNVLLGKSFIEQYTSKNNLNMKTLLTWYIEDTGGQVLENPEDDAIIINSSDIMSGKIHKYLLG